MVRRQHRFALDKVTLNGEAMGGATIDVWEDEAQGERWAARLLCKAAQLPGDGVLEGSTRDGRRLRGDVRIGANRPGPGGSRVVLLELLGEGPLREVDPAVEAATGDEARSE